MVLVVVIANVLDMLAAPPLRMMERLRPPDAAV
jgi:hypothetical protein